MDISDGIGSQHALLSAECIPEMYYLKEAARS